MAKSGGTATNATLRGTLPTTCMAGIFGDSTIAAYSGQNGIDYYLLTDADRLLGSTVVNNAAPGHTINQQLAVWNADTNKALYDVICCQIGLNDLDPAEAASVAIARIQALVTAFVAGKKSSAIVLLGAMNPCRSRLISLYGAGPGATAYAKWQGMNTAIMGGGATPITGVNYRTNEHIVRLDDGAGSLNFIYDTGDSIHPTNEGRYFVGQSWRNALRPSGYLTPGAPGAIDNLWSALTTTSPIVAALKAPAFMSIGGATVGGVYSVEMLTAINGGGMRLKGSGNGGPYIELDAINASSALRYAVLFFSKGGTQSYLLGYRAGGGFCVYDVPNSATRLMITTAGVVGIGAAMAGSDSAAGAGLTVDTSGNVASLGYMKPASYTVATLPSASAAGAGAQAWVTNESGGAVMAHSNGTLWKRAGTQTNIS